MRPRISVIVPVYNVERYLKKCLESLEGQKFEDFEVIVVDDGSTDSSLDIALSFEQKDQRFRVLSQSNKGLGGARNTGIAAARGEFLFMLDSDDYIRDDTFHSLMCYRDEHDLDILVFNYDRVSEDGTLISRPEFKSGVSSGEEAFKKVISLKTSPQACNKLYKTSLFVENDIHYPENFLHEDIAVCYRLFWLAKKVGYTNASYYFWVIREGSITSDSNYQHINDVLTSLLKIQQHLLEHDVFERFKKEYVQGCVKMLNLMMERAISNDRLGCLDYLQFIINQDKLNINQGIACLENYEKSLYRKFQWLYKLTNEKAAIIKSLGADHDAHSKTKQNSGYFRYKARYPLAFIRKSLYKLSYILFPLESPRREALKKILRRYF